MACCKLSTEVADETSGGGYKILNRALLQGFDTRYGVEMPVVNVLPFSVWAPWFMRERPSIIGLGFMTLHGNSHWKCGVNGANSGESPTVQWITPHGKVRVSLFIRPVPTSPLDRVFFRTPRCSPAGTLSAGKSTRQWWVEFIGLPLRPMI